MNDVSFDDMTRAIRCVDGSVLPPVYTPWSADTLEGPDQGDDDGTSNLQPTILHEGMVIYPATISRPRRHFWARLTSWLRGWYG